MHAITLVFGDYDGTSTCIALLHSSNWATSRPDAGTYTYTYTYLSKRP